MLRKTITEIKNNRFKWLVTALSITGVILNIYQLKICFAIWVFTNGVWCIIDWQKKLYSQSFLFFVYFCLAIWGLVKW